MGTGYDSAHVVAREFHGRNEYAGMSVIMLWPPPSHCTEPRLWHNFEMAHMPLFNCRSANGNKEKTTTHALGIYIYIHVNVLYHEWQAVERYGWPKMSANL
jgi:hypothetical protein